MIRDYCRNCGHDFMRHPSPLRCSDCPCERFVYGGKKLVCDGGIPSQKVDAYLLEQWERGAAGWEVTE